MKSVVKKPSAPAKAPASGSARLAAVVRGARVLVLALGFACALLGLTSTFGVATDNFTIRVIVALVLLVGLPLFVSDKILSRMKAPSDRLGIVLDVFGVFWVALAWLFVAAVPRVLVSEGDRQTRAGSLWLAKTTYALGGVTPKFRTERTVSPSPSAAPSSAPAASATKDAN